VRHPEWARENVGAQTVQKTVNGLINVVKGDWPAVSKDVKLVIKISAAC